MGRIRKRIRSFTLERCGLLVAGSGESAVIRGQEACYREHDLPHEILDSEQVSSRYPGML